MIVTEDVVENVPSRGQPLNIFTRFRVSPHATSSSLPNLLAFLPIPDAEERFLLVERRLRDIVVRALRNPALVGFVKGLETLLGEFAQVCYRTTVPSRSPTLQDKISTMEETFVVLLSGLRLKCRNTGFRNKTACIERPWS